MIIDKIKAGSIIIDPMLVSLVKELKAANKKVVLLTAHRRESFGEGLENIFNAVRTMSALIPDVAFIYPHHPNPHVVQAITASGIDRVAGVHMLPPLDYAHLVYCLLESNWIATDSGGIQEEAISLGKPVVVLRELTERIEGVWDGIAQLAGTNSEKIIQCMLHAHTQKQSDSSKNIYGDGQAGKKIASFIMSVQTEKHPVIGSTNKPVHSLFDQNVNP
jgi:UDP-N-acetylglucosamine 2-epimerase (non-hydrolysing)